MDTAFLIATAIAAIILLTTLLAWWRHTERRDLAFLGSLSAISSAGVAMLWLN
jgi:hypothetical protein